MPRFDDYEEEQQPQRDHNRCAANGCPLLGSLSQSVNGSDKWYCRYHFGVDSRDWGNITLRIKRSMQQLREYDVKKRTNPYSKENEDTLKKAVAWIKEGVTPREPEKNKLKDLIGKAVGKTKAPGREHV